MQEFPVFYYEPEQPKLKSSFHSLNQFSLQEANAKYNQEQDIKVRHGAYLTQRREISVKLHSSKVQDLESSGSCSRQMGQEDEERTS